MKVVKVLWVDSCNSNMNWTVAEDIEVELMYIDSFGVVVKDTDEFLSIAQNYGDDPKQYSNITTIPKGCIKEVFVIHENNVCENEQKTTGWSEEDEKMLKWVTGYLENKMLNAPMGEERTACKNAIAWLEKLEGEQKPAWSEKYIADVFEKVGLAKIVREQSNDNLTIALQSAMIELSKFTPQPKQEWSEEDKRKIDRIYSILRQASDTHAFSTSCRLIGDKECIELQDFLKSITLHNTWKPSDEQMDALLYVVRNYTPGVTERIAWESIKTLELMFKDLKKLKGEQL